MKKQYKFSRERVASKKRRIKSFLTKFCHKYFKDVKIEKHNYADFGNNIKISPREYEKNQLKVTSWAKQVSLLKRGTYWTMIEEYDTRTTLRNSPDHWINIKGSLKTCLIKLREILRLANL